MHSHDLYNNMKLSVFVVTYNQEKYIRQCLDSILMQKVDFDYEVVIGEDHSTDGTRAICEEYAAKYPQVRLLPLTDNLGVAENWNRVLQECNGDYIAMCEGDDYWTDDDKLQKQMDFMKIHPHCMGCFHNAELIGDNGQLLGRMHNGVMECEYEFDKVVSGWFIPTASLFFRKSHGIISGFAALSKYSYLSADRLLHALISNEGNIGYINETMSVWRRSGSSLSFTIDNIPIFKGNITLYSKLKKYMPKCREKVLKKRVFEWHGILALEYLKNSLYVKYVIELLKTLFLIRTFIDFKTFIKNYLFRVK